MIWQCSTDDKFVGNTMNHQAKSPTSFLWIVPLSLVWPAIQSVVFLMRFGRLPPLGIKGAGMFLPMGMLSGGVLIVLCRIAAGDCGRVIRGYLYATPVALIGSVVGGLLVPPAFATILFGALPLIIGSILGFKAGTDSAKKGTGATSPGS